MDESGSNENAFAIAVSLIAVGLIVAYFLRARLRQRWATSIVPEYTTGILVRDGVRVRELAPGRHRINGLRERVIAVGMRARLLDVRGQEVLGADGFAVKASMDVQYRITDPLTFLAAAEDGTEGLYVVRIGGAAAELLRIRAAAVLRDAVGKRSLSDLLEQRDELRAEIVGALHAPASEFGMEIDDVILSDIMLPGPVKKLMAAKVQAQMEGEAALERARAEHATMRSLANTARLLTEHPELGRLRLLQEISSAPNPTFVVDVDGGGRGRTVGAAGDAR